MSPLKSSLLGIGTAVLLVTVSSALVFAEVKSSSPVQSLNGHPATPVKKISARDTSNLRCWQYGELLFERNQLIDRKLADKGNMMVFAKKSDHQSSEIYLIELGSATCLYEKI